MRIYTGQRFLNICRRFEDFKKRRQFGKLKQYLENGPDGRVCILNGLRRTGKSVMMCQSFLEMSDGERQKTAYILCDANDSMDDLDIALAGLSEQGIMTFFIDEVTIIPDFVRGGQFLADGMGKDARIVLTGTDSLGFTIAESSILAGRHVSIHTTFIPFYEHSLLLGTDSLDEYVMGGGILPPDRIIQFREYPLSAIALNLQNSLKNAGFRFGSLLPLYENGSLPDFVQRVIRDDSHRFFSRALAEKWKLSDFMLPASFRMRKDADDLLALIDREMLLDRILERIGAIKNCGISERQRISEVAGWLREMKIVKPVPVIFESDILYADDDPDRRLLDEKVENKLRFPDMGQNGEWLLTQPGLRWAQIETALSELARTSPFRQGENPKIALAMAAIFENARDNAMGHVLEDIVVNETMEAAGGNKTVFRYRPLNGDIDMVVWNCGECELYEIKHSDQTSHDFSRHMRDPKTEMLLKRQFGPITSRNILYSGESCEKNGIRYINTAEYLRKLWDDPLGHDPETLTIPEKAAYP